MADEETGAVSTTDPAERLMKARCRLMVRAPWYGHIAMNMTWISSQMPWMPEQRRTMGVRIVNGGEVQCLYYPPFVQSMTIKEIYAVIQHEIEHIVRLHCLREGGRMHEAWNVAADMTINGKRTKPRIGYKQSNTNETIIPYKGQIVWIPEDWDETKTSEQFYEMLMKNQPKAKPCPKCGKSCGSGGKGKKDNSGDEGDEGDGKAKGKGKSKGKGGAKGEGGDGNSCGSGGGGDPGESEQGKGKCSACGQSDDGNEYEFGGVSGKQIDDHSIWNQSDVSQDEARQIVKDMVDQASEKAQGHVPGHLEEAIKQLGKPVIRWRELLRHYLGKHVGNQRMTYSRRNRRHDRFGMPGVSHHAAATCNVIIDTSGSVGTKELQQFFAEIDQISSRTKVFVLQWDHAFQGFQQYRRNDWKKFKVHGRGGTDMAAPVEWLIKNKKVSDVQIMLTDGYCNWADKTKVNFPFITVITTPQGTTSQPEFGHTVRMGKI